MQWQQKQAADKGQSHNHAYHADVSSNFFLPHMLEYSVCHSFTLVSNSYDLSEQLLSNNASMICQLSSFNFNLNE
jgi:hypothetical protein